MEFSEKLKSLRNEKGVSQQELADAIFVSRSAVAKWENGLGLPGQESLKLLCDYFNVEEASLVSENETKSVQKNLTIFKYKKLSIVFCSAAAIFVSLLIVGVSLYLSGALFPQTPHLAVVPQNFPYLTIENVTATSYVITNPPSGSTPVLYSSPLNDKAKELPLLPYQSTYSIDLPEYIRFSSVRYYFLNDDYSPITEDTMSTVSPALSINPERMWFRINYFDASILHEKRSELDIFYIQNDYHVIILEFTYEYDGFKAISCFRVER